MSALYLDHHATTPCDPSVVEQMIPWFTEHFGNPGSRQHSFGLRAAAAVDLSRERVASLIGARPEQIVFTSGATEADNLAIFGVARASSKRHLITCTTEHHAVLDPMRHLAAQGWTLTELVPDRAGLITADQVEAALTPDTALVSVMLGNNEIGTIQPVAEIARRCRARGVLVHTDAVQAAGRLPLDVGALDVDLMSLTAHKVYGPKGVGALFVRDPSMGIEPLQLGGGQERGLRSGTLPVPLLVGFGAACVVAAASIAAGEPERQRALGEVLWRGLRPLGGVHLNGPAEGRLAGNVHVSFEGVTSATLMAELRPIAVSAGSACGTGRTRPSHVLEAIGLPDPLARAALRFGLGRSTTEADIVRVIDRLSEVLPRLRLRAAPAA